MIPIDPEDRMFAATIILGAWSLVALLAYGLVRLTSALWHGWGMAG